MERQRSDPEVTYLWYAVTCLVGIYWSISLLSKSFNLQFMCWGPLITCLGAALHLTGGFGPGILYRAFNLFAIFGIGIGIGGGLQILGVVQFFHDRLAFLELR